MRNVSGGANERLRSEASTMLRSSKSNWETSLIKKALVLILSLAVLLGAITFTCVYLNSDSFTALMSAVIVAVASAVILCVIALVIFRIASPRVEGFLAGMEEIASGNADARVETRGGDEARMIF